MRRSRYAPAVNAAQLLHELYDYSMLQTRREALAKWVSLPPHPLA